MSRCLFVLMFACLLLHGVARAADEPLAFTAPQLQHRYDALLQELRCLVCQNQTLADSHAELAQDLRTQVMGGATASEIKRSAAQRGMISLRADGRDKICEGVTTPDEVLRVTQLDVD